MSDSMQIHERRVADARIAVHRDLEDLGRELRRDGAKLKQYGLALAGAAAAIGFLVGMGGLKAVKGVLAVGAVAAAGFVFARKRGYIAAPGTSS